MATASKPGAPVARDYATIFNPPFALDARKSALVIIDMQHASGSRHHGLGALLQARGEAALGAYRFDRIETIVVPTIARLLARFRAHGLPVIFLTVGSQLPDFSDLLPSMRGFAQAIGNTAGTLEHRILEELAPRRGEPVLNKTTMSAFHSSGFERTVQALGVTQLCFTGISTNSCVEGTARDAADRGFQCVIVDDGCGAAAQALHDATCVNFARLLGRVATADAVLDELGLTDDRRAAAG
ncbi:MAG TPA: cysteine hydrolase [Vineibacter sp.]|nr:cysteine hydrolase [Vineibacter sp.]